MYDWTTLDPAIVSFRQYPSFMPGPPPQQQQQQHQSQNENMFMQQKSNEYSNRNNLMQSAYGPHGINLQNSIMNQQQQQQPPPQNSQQVNFYH